MASGSFAMSSAAPCRMTSPSSMTYAWSTIFSVSLTWWSVMSMDRPSWSLSSRTIRCMSSTAFGSTPANGSSSMRSFGLVHRQRAMLRRRFSPPERVSACAFLSLVMRKRSMRWSALLMRFFLLRFFCVSRTASRLSRTVSLRKMDSSWGRYPIPSLARLCMGSVVMSLPPKVTVPLFGGTSPAIM